MRTVILAFALAACTSAPQQAAPAAPPEPAAIALESEPQTFSSADSLLLLLNTPETFDVLRKHIPFFVNLTEHGLIPPFASDFTLDHLLQVPEARVTPATIAAMNAEFAKIPR
jgi:hypothetical protein